MEEMAPEEENTHHRTGGQCRDRSPPVGAMEEMAPEEENTHHRTRVIWQEQGELVSGRLQ